MFFGSYENPVPLPHQNKRLSVLDECEEDAEIGRRDTTYEGSWEHTGLPSVTGEHAFMPEIGSSLQRCPAKRTSWKNRISNSKLKVNPSFIPSLRRTEEQDTPDLDRTIVKTISHTSTVTYGYPTLHRNGYEDDENSSLHGSFTKTSVRTSLDLERERIQRLFEDDLHQKRLELKKMKYDVDRGRFHISQGDGEMRRKAVDVGCRIRRLNDRITTLISKHSGCIRI